MDYIKEVERKMSADELQKLRVREDEAGGTNLVLDEKILANVREYKIESSTGGMAELTVKLLVNFP